MSLRKFPKGELGVGADKVALDRLLGELRLSELDFLAVNGNIGRGAYADADLLAIHRQDGHGYVVVDDDLFADFACEDQHSASFLRRMSNRNEFILCNYRANRRLNENSARLSKLDDMGVL
jgi:hypothetical protein